MFASVYVCEQHISMNYITKLENQGLQYLNFTYEQKVLSYALKHGIWRNLFFNISAYFYQIEKMESKLTSHSLSLIMYTINYGKTSPYH